MQPDEGADRCLLIRYGGEGDRLIRFEAYCHQDSTYGVAHAEPPRRTTVLDGLTPP